MAPAIATAAAVSPLAAAAARLSRLLPVAPHYVGPRMGRCAFLDGCILLLECARSTCELFISSYHSLLIRVLLFSFLFLPSRKRKFFAQQVPCLQAVEVFVVVSACRKLALGDSHCIRRFFVCSSNLSFCTPSVVCVTSRGSGVSHDEAERYFSGWLWAAERSLPCPRIVAGVYPTGCVVTNAGASE